MEHVLITGGAGFIGRQVVGEMLRRGHRVRVLDSLIEQVHGDVERPPLLNDEVELIRGDVRNGDVVAKALKGVDSFLSIVQMPGGVPVGTLAIGRSGAINAALLAASILALSDKGIATRLDRWRAQQTGSVAKRPSNS